MLFVDMVGYSALAQKNEALSLELLEEYRKLLRSIFPRYGGREVDTTGDELFVEFASALEDARCAYEIQKTLFEHNVEGSPERQIRVRMGLHVGDVMHLGEHVHGDKVNIAARIYPLAEPGGICLSEDIFRQIQNQMEVPMVKLGKAELKNIQVSMAIYRMVMPWEKRQLPWFERLKFRLRQKKGQQAALMVKTLLIAAILILAGLYVWQWMEGKKEDLAVKSKKETSQMGSTHSSQQALTLDKHRIAVLPFINMSGDAENEYFSDGMTEEMISQLSKIRDLSVIARTSVMGYKGTNKKIAEIGRELGVGTILEGSVRKAENQVRITAQLIDVQSQMHLWAEDYNREIKGIFVIQSDIAERVAEALKVQLMVGEKQRIKKKGTENTEAYNLYLKGRYYFYKFTKEEMEKSLKYFEQAIEKDPTYAQAYTGLAYSYANMGWVGYLPLKEVYPKAKAKAEKALEMDSTLAGAYLTLADIKMLYDLDWSGAEKAFKQALELNPNHVDAHWDYALYLTYRRRFDEAITQIKRAEELDPLSVPLIAGSGEVFVNARQYDQAIEQLQKGLDMDPNYFFAHQQLGWAYWGKGRYEEGIAEVQKAIDLSGEAPWPISNLGQMYALSGRRAEARKVLAELKERAKREFIPPGAFAYIYAALGEKDQALEWFEKAYEERSDVSLHYLKLGLSLDSLRSDPRFIEWMRKVGFEK